LIAVVPEMVDAFPAMVVPALILLALAFFMNVTGPREARRRHAWDRFESLIRIRGVSRRDRESMADWARVSCPDAPHLVLCRRRDFDSFSRSELQRLRSLGGLGGDAYGLEVERVGALRRRLGFGPRPHNPQSSHDLRQQERVELVLDDGRRLDLQVTSVDEEAFQLKVLRGPARDRRLGPGWASFSREGEGTYRFRTAPLPHRAGLGHGDFLIHEERRRDPRVALVQPPFWLSVERLPDGAAPEDPEGVEVELIDVSVGGLALLADRQVRKGSELEIDLPLGAGLAVPGLRARVLSQGFREGGGERPYFLHCQFVGIETSQEEVLKTFVWSRASDE
jgi:hypothetical protein